MATGGVGRLATKNTCSICLEPFKGRFPKLLPCFHTFCLPCLNQMVTRTVSQVGQFGSGQTETIITCPTCRKDCVVPSGGVAELQKNFYIEQEEDAGQGHLQPIICDLCDQGQVASHRCTRCQLMLCFHCHRGHRNCHIAVRSNNERGGDAPTDENLQQLVDKGRDQMKVIERMVNKLAEDESELNQQRKKLEQELTNRYNTQMRKIKSHADAEEDRMKKNKADLQYKLDTLSQLLSNAEPSSLSAPSLMSALLPDADVSMMRDKTERDSRQTDFFKPLAASLNLGSAVQGHSDAGFDDGLLFGDGNQQPGSSLVLEASQLQQATRMNELAQKVDMLMRQAHEQKTKSENKELIAEIRAMHDKNTILLQEVAALQAENGKVQTDFSSFQAQSGKLQKDVSVLQSESGKLQKDVSVLQSESGKMQKDVSVLQSDNGKLQKDFSGMKTQSEKMQKNISNVKSENGNLRKNVASLQSGFAHSASRVAFYAYLGADMETADHELLINDQVSLNIGDGYDAQSGIFTVPISGLYMFSAGVMPSCTDQKASASIRIFVHRNEDTLTLCSCTSSEIGTSCCGQGVFHFGKGDQVYLHTLEEQCSFSRTNIGTFFCGALIQPDL